MFVSSAKISYAKRTNSPHHTDARIIKRVLPEKENIDNGINEKKLPISIEDFAKL